MMTKRIKLFCYLLITAIIFWSIYLLLFSDLFSEKSIFIDQNEKEQIIKIGVILPLSLETAYSGEWVKEGITLALENFNNKNNGNNNNSNIIINVIYEDDQCNPQKAVQSFNKLTAVDNVSIIIGPVCSSSVLAVSPLAEQQKIIIFSPVATSTKITTAGQYVFRNRESDVIHGKTMAEFTYNNLNSRKAAILYINLDNGIGFRDSFKNQFVKLGGTITVEEAFQKGEKDFRTQLLKIRNSNPDAIYFAGQRMENAILQAKELGITAQIIAPPTMQSPETLTVAKDTANGIYYTYQQVDQNDKNNEKITAYQQKYSERYNKTSESYAANSYDAFMLLADGSIFCSSIKDIKNTDTILAAECIKDYLLSIKNYAGVSGNFSFDENGDVIRVIGIKQIVDGKFIVVE